MVSIEIKGITRTSRFLNNKRLGIFKGQEKGLKEAAEELEGEVKSSIAGRRAEPTSVDTGHFLRTVSHISGKDSATVFSPVKYSKFLEYGTTRGPERAHFRNSLSRTKDKISKIINKEISKQIRF